MREKCPNTDFWSVFSCIRTEYGDILNLNILSECRKIRTRKNSLFGHFSRSDNRDILACYEIENYVGGAFLKSKLFKKLVALLIAYRT